MSDFRAYGRKFIFDTKARWVIGQDDSGCWMGPNLIEDFEGGRYYPTWSALKFYKPWHLAAIVKTYITGRVALLEVTR